MKILCWENINVHLVNGSCFSCRGYCLLIPVFIFFLAQLLKATSLENTSMETRLKSSSFLLDKVEHDYS